MVKTLFSGSNPENTKMMGDWSDDEYGNAEVWDDIEARFMMMHMFSSVDTITVKELYRERSLRKHHHGKVLHGQLSRDLMLRTEDEEPLLCDYLGKRVVIKEPLIEMNKDGMYILQVVDSDDVICLDRVNMPTEDPIDVTPVEELQRIRLQGNHFFAKGNWNAAVNRYSQCIENASDTINEMDRNNILMLAYSNRAEARLRLRHYDHALSDADEALQIEPNHVKTLLRKGKAAHGLGLFEQSCEAFKAALEHSPEEESIVKCLNSSIASLEQSLTGKYDLYEYFRRNCTGEAPSCVDFVGPVEIRRVSYLNGGRGLFATRNVKAGEVLLVSNALARVPTDQNWRKNLIAELANKVWTSMRKMAQLHSFAKYGNPEMEVPSMELFKPGSNWSPPGAEKLKFDVAVVHNILRLNAFEKFPRKDSRESPSSHGIWGLPSFSNHSCTPNVFSFPVGDALFFHASKDTMKGEELTTTYIGDGTIMDQVDGRQALTMKGWCFTCKCSRCLLEEPLRSKLSEIGRPRPSLLFNLAANIPLSEKPICSLPFQLHRFETGFASIADEVEEVILSLSPRLGLREKCLLRALFLPPLRSKASLATEHGDVRAAITTLTQVLDATTSVWVNFYAVEAATALLDEIEKFSSKDGQLFRRTFDRLLGFCRVVYGDLPECRLRSLLSQYIRNGNYGPRFA
ncbi:unnamed protein product [Calypogeia fissa]